MNKNITLKPISPLATLLWFLILGIFLYFSIHLLMPVLLAANIPHFFAFTWTLYLPMGLLIPISLIAMKREGLTLNRRLRECVRARPGKKRVWSALCATGTPALCAAALPGSDRAASPLVAITKPTHFWQLDAVRCRYPGRCSDTLARADATASSNSV